MNKYSMLLERHEKLMLLMKEKVAQLTAERDAFKLLYQLSNKPVDATQKEIVAAHQIVQAHFKAEKDGEGG